MIWVNSMSSFSSISKYKNIAQNSHIKSAYKTDKTDKTDKINKTENTDKSDSKDLSSSALNMAGIIDESSDTETSYQVIEESAITNEAEAEFEKAKNSGQKMKKILDQIMDTCTSKNGDMQALSGDLSKYSAQISDIMATAEGIGNDAAKEILDMVNNSEKVQAELDNIEKQVQSELDKLNKELSKGEKADRSIIDASNEKIDKLYEKMDKLNNQRIDNSKTIRSAANHRAQVLDKSKEGIYSVFQNATNKAIDANEYAELSISKGSEVSKYNASDAYKNGWTTQIDLSSVCGSSSSFMNSSMTIGDQTSALYDGYKAIALGEQLGAASKNVLKDVQNIGSQYGVSAGYIVEDIVNKEYVDTSKLANIKEFDNTYKSSANSTFGFGSMNNSFSSFGSSTLSSIESQMQDMVNRKNQQIFSSNLDIYKNIAEASKNKKV